MIRLLGPQMWLVICLSLFLGGLTTVAAPIAFAADEAADADHADEGDGHDHDGEGGEDHADGDHADGDHAEGDHAEDGSILSFDIGSAVWNLIIFGCVFAVLATFVWPGVLGGLQAREDKIRSDLESAEQANAKAKSLLGEYQQKLDEAATQVQVMLADARRDADANGQKIVEDAKKEAERQRERAVSDIETAKQVALADLAGQTSDLAMNVARSVVGRELNPNDHADLIRQSLDQLPSNN
ncbi:MAG: F0F1 ATP synthase subunit B [Planctomycetota bacterium]